jgi:hypothetical protein
VTDGTGPTHTRHTQETKADRRAPACIGPMACLPGCAWYAWVTQGALGRWGVARVVGAIGPAVSLFRLGPTQGVPASRVTATPKHDQRPKKKYGLDFVFDTSR